MSGPFAAKPEGVGLTLGQPEVAVLRTVPMLLDTGTDAKRLDYTPYPDDPAAAERYRELVGDDLDHLRGADRRSFEEVLSGEPVPAETLEAFMRVVGEARLVLAARLGIENDGWEAELERGDDPELALLGWLGYLQDAAVEVLSGSL